MILQGGYFIGMDTIEEICAEHGIISDQKQRKVLDKLDALYSNFIEQAIESVNDDEAIEKVNSS